MILHNKPSNKKFIIQLEEYKIKVSINVHTHLVITRMRNRLTWVQFLHALNIADLSEMKTYQAGLLSKSIFSSFCWGFEFCLPKICYENREVEWQIIGRLMMVFRLRKTGCKKKNWAEQIAKERRKLTQIQGFWKSYLLTKDLKPHLCRVIY